MLKITNVDKSCITKLYKTLDKTHIENKIGNIRVVTHDYNINYINKNFILLRNVPFQILNNYLQIHKNEQ